MEKIILLTTLIASLSILLMPALVIAQTEQLNYLRESVDVSTADLNLGSEDLPTKIGTIIGFWFSLIGVVFLLMVLLGGVLWMMAGGNDEKVQRAVKIIIGGVEGMIITFMAYALLFVVLGALKYATP